MKRSIRMCVLAMASLLIGCAEESPPTPDSTDAFIEQLATLRDATKVAAEASEPQTEASAESAKRARELLTAYRDANTNEGDEDPAPAEAVRIVVEAERWSRIATERAQLTEALDGFVARSYRTTRGAGIKAVFKTLAFAARQADEHGPDELPQVIVDAAETAAVFAENVSGRRVALDGTTDWATIANDMDAYADDPPPALRQLIALAWLSVGQTGVALAELETVDPDTITNDRQRAGHHLLRGLLYRLRGFPTLGTAELDVVAEYDEALGAYGPELQSGAYVLVAAFQIHDGRYGEADRMIADAIRAWPENPLAVYITGEKLAETGEYVAAAESLERAAAETEWGWLADKIAERARQLRDGQHASESLIDDPAFLRQVTMRYVWEVAEKSEPAAKVRELLDAARSLGGRLVDKIPGLGTEVVDPPAE